MNEVLVFISAYLPCATAVITVVVACLSTVKKVKDAVNKSDIKSVKDDTKLLYSRLQEEIDLNRQLKEELHDLRLELKGIRPHEKVRKN